MVDTNRRGMSDGQSFAVTVLFLVGLFIVFCGTGMSSASVGGLGGVIGLLIPSLIVVSSRRHSNQRYVFARAQVLRATAQPITGNRRDQCTMLLFVHAPGIDSVEVLVKDPDVPIDTWPYPGAELPVLIPNGNPRRIKVLWEEVHSAADLAPTDTLYDEESDTQDFGGALVPGQPAEEPAYQAAGGYEPTSSAGAPAEDGSAPPRRRPSPFPRQPSDTIVTGDTVVVAHAPVPRTPVEDSEMILRTAPGPETKPARPSVTGKEPERSGMVSQAEPPEVENDAVSNAVIPDQGTTNATPPPEAPPVSGAPPVSETPSPARVETSTETPAEAASGGNAPPVHGHAGDSFPPAYVSDPPRLASAPTVDHGLHGVSITLIVSNLERSLAFYRDTVGLAEIDSGTGSAVLASGQARIMLRQVPDMQPVDRRVTHVNLEVEDVHAEYDRLKAAGVEFGHRPRVVTRGEQLEQWAATFRDPDGHAVTLTRWESRP